MAPTEIGRKWLEDAQWRFRALPEAEVVLAHHGAVLSDTIGSLLGRAEEASKEAGDALPVRKRMMNVLVEGLENIQHHAMDGHQETSFVLLGRYDRGYFISLGNAVPLAMAALLHHRLGILNEMDTADLKEHYLKLLSNSARSSQGGAGLGLVTMSRKSERPMEVRTCKLSDTTALLILELRVPVRDQITAAA